MDNSHQKKLFLSTSELVCLLQAVNVAHLTESILKAQEVKPSDLNLKDAQERLTQRGLLDKAGKIDSQYQGTLAPLFHPDTMLMLVRIYSNAKQESLTFLQKSDAVLLYYFIPDKDLHCIESIDAVERVMKLTAEWYTLQQFQPIEMSCSLSAETFEQTRSFVQQGETRTAVEILEKAKCPGQMNEQIITALRMPLFSGSVAVLELSNDTALDGYSFALLAREETIWHIYQPDDNPKQLIIDGDTKSLARLFDKIIQQFLGGNMLDKPLDKKNIVTFTLSSDELAYCLHAINAPTLSAKLLKTAYPELPEQELMSYLRDAAGKLSARGWCKSTKTGLPIPVARLESAVFPLARYDYVVQAEITRPDLHSFATINVLNGRSFTSLLHPSKDLYVLEHGHLAALSAYISKLFLDFGKGNGLSKVKKHKINYALVSAAMEGGTKDQLDNLIQAGFSKIEAEQFALDLSDIMYRGSIIRVNANSQLDPIMAQQITKPVLLLLRGTENSWLFEFPSADDDIGLVSLVDRNTFEKILTTFVN